MGCMTTWLTTDDVAALLTTTPGRVRILTRDEGLPVSDVPGIGPRYDAAEVDRWMRAKKKPEPASAERA